MATDNADVNTSKVIECRSYTHARRFPLKIGNIQGLRLRIPWTPAQLGVAVSSWIMLGLTRELWGHLTPIGNAMLFLGLPPFLAWKARASRIEGRAPWRAAIGWLTLHYLQLLERYSSEHRDNAPQRFRMRVPVENRS